MASCTIASIHASGLDHHMHERSPHPNLKLNPDPLPQAGERCVVCGRTLGLCVFCATASSTASVAAIRDPHANGRHAPTPNARPYATLRSNPAPARSDPTQPNPTQSYPTGGCLVTSWLFFLMLLMLYGWFGGRARYLSSQIWSVDTPAFPPRPSVPTRFRPLAMSAPHDLPPVGAEAQDARAERQRPSAADVPPSAPPVDDDTTVSRSRSRSPWRRWAATGTVTQADRRTGEAAWWALQERWANQNQPLPFPLTRLGPLAQWIGDEHDATVAPHQPVGAAAVTAVAPQQPPDAAVEGATVAPHQPQLSDEQLAQRGLMLGVLQAQDVRPRMSPEGLRQREHRVRAWGRVTRAAEIRLSRAVRETLASVDRLRFDVDSVPACLGEVEASLAPVIARLDVFSRACVEEADLCAMYIRELGLFEAELAANARPSDDSEPEPTPNASASSGGP